MRNSEITQKMRPLNNKILAACAGNYIGAVRTIAHLQRYCRNWEERYEEETNIRQLEAYLKVYSNYGKERGFRLCIIGPDKNEVSVL